MNQGWRISQTERRLRVYQEGEAAQTREVGLLRHSKWASLTTAEGVMRGKVGELVG